MGKLIVTIIVALIVAAPGGIALFRDFMAVKYDLHEQMIASYQGQIKSAEERGAVGEANAIRKDYETYEKGWRAKQTIEETSILILYSYSEPEGVPEHQKEKFSDAIYAIENSQLLTSTDTASLAATYLGAGYYKKASESFSIVLAEDPDDTDAKIFKADALVSIVATSPDFEITGAPPELGISAIDLITEANELIIFDNREYNTELSMPQINFIDKIKTNIDKLELKIDGRAPLLGPAGD